MKHFFQLIFERLKSPEVKISADDRESAEALKTVINAVEEQENKDAGDGIPHGGSTGRWH